MVLHQQNRARARGPRPAAKASKYRRLMCSWGAVLAVVAGIGAAARGDPPVAMYIFPAGGQRGAEVRFRVGGLYFHDACAFAIEGRGLEADSRIERTSTTWFEGPLIPIPDSQAAEDYPQDHLGSVRISPEAPLGAVPWRVWTSQGMTAARPFIVGDLPEVVEQEIDGAPVPVTVALPVTINGRIFPREDVDVYQFECRAGQVVTGAVLAGRLGSPLDPHLEIRDSGGRRLAESDQTVAPWADGFVRFRAPSDGLYQVRIHDARYSGLQHYVYRLTLTAGPFVDALFPLGGRQGEVTRFELLGQNLETPFLELALPAAGPRQPAAHLVGPRHGNSLPVETDTLPEVIEQEPNDDAQGLKEISIPAVWNGRVDKPGDVDCWVFRAAKEQRLEFDLRAARLGSALDSRLEIRDRRGNVLVGPEASSRRPDALLVFTAPADDAYVACVGDQFPGRGGPAFAYRLRVAPQRPGFSLLLNADALTVTRGQEAQVNVSVARAGGFAGEIKLDVQGLPAGVTIKNNVIPANANDVGLVFQAEPGAPVGASRVRISGRAEIDGQPVEGTATVKPAMADLPSMDQLWLAVALRTPFTIKGVYEVKYAARGTQFTRQFTIDRGGYEGPLEVRLADRQARHLQGVTGPSITVPAGASEFTYTVTLPPWMEIGRTSRSLIMATGTIEDPPGVFHKVSFTSAAQNEQIVALIDPGPLSLDLDGKSLSVAAGGQGLLRARVGRGPGLDRDVVVSLVVPEHMRGVSAEPATVPADQDRAALVVKVAPTGAGPFNMPLAVRATLTREDGSPVVAEAKFELVAPAGP